MENNNHVKENKKMIVKSLVSSNIEVYKVIRERFSQLSELQTYTTLFLKLGYTKTEVRLLLEIQDDKIIEMEEVVRNLQIDIQYERK